MKKILFIAPAFFEYEKKIKENLEKLNFDVDYIPENIFDTNIWLKIKYKIYKTKICDKYFLKKIKKKYDIIFIIRGYYLSKKIMESLKEKNPNAKFVMYQWDSVKNNKNAELISKYCENCLTFDIEDSKKYGWGYRPLFYIEQTHRNIKRKYDMTFIGTLHSQRIKIYKYIKDKFDKNCNFLYIYSKKFNFFKQKYFCKNIDYVQCNNDDVKFKSLSLRNVNEIMALSNIIIDYTHPNQTGLTMRTCESIGHRCKLITNNYRVKELNFYNPNNVYVYDINNIEIPDEFIETQYVELENEIYKYYSIHNWINEILNIK